MLPHGSPAASTAASSRRAPAGAGREVWRPRALAEVFAQARRALDLVWRTSPRLTVLLGALTLVGGVLPASVAWIARHVVDEVVAAADQGGEPMSALRWVALEAGIVAVVAGVQACLGMTRSLLRAQLGHRVNVMILEKALTLELSQFEDSAFYDKLTRARREASVRPLSMVMRTFGLVQSAVAVCSYGALLATFSPWAVALVVVAGLPAFVVEAKFSGDAFRLFRWRSPETRRQIYLETVLAREDYAKEVQIYGLGPLLLGRYSEIFHRLYGEDRALTLRRGAWGWVLGLVGTATFYGAQAWVVVATVAGEVSLGEMTMYLLAFRAGQAGVAAILEAVGGMYEDNLYLSTLYEYLEQPAVAATGGTATQGPAPGDGIRFEGVTFQYPGAPEAAVEAITLHLRPGCTVALVGENGSGKTTLIKLATRLVRPTAGRILLDGLPLDAWDAESLRRRVAVIFQDFARYQWMVGENIGAGDVARFGDRAGWEDAARRGLADEFVSALPHGYETQLGKWFDDGRELSGGQWQKIALARAFMRDSADLLVLDEPTAAMDAEAEARLFEHVRVAAQGKMVVLISHRFSTVRAADHIVVLERGRIVEEGDHAALLALRGRYAHLFELQAAGYR